MCHCLSPGKKIFFIPVLTQAYDPVTGRFVNADAILGANGDMLSYNLFAYCGDNPIMRADPTGSIAVADDVVIGIIVVCVWLFTVTEVALASEATTWGNNALQLPESKRKNNILPFPPIAPSPKRDPQPVPAPKSDNPPEDTLVYRWAAGRNKDPREYRNLTPRPWSDNDGLSFSLVPSTSRGNAVTTLSALRSKGFSYVVVGTHVSVMPPGGQVALDNWKSSYDTANTNPHIFTLWLYTITTAG